MNHRLKNSILAALLLIFVTGCSSKEVKRSQNDTNQDINLVKKSKKYTDKQYKNGEVVLHEYVQVQGEIVKIDGEGKRVEKNSRFILKTKDGQYQIINGIDCDFEIGDSVIVYGEYYGFIKAMKISVGQERR